MSYRKMRVLLNCFCGISIIFVIFVSASEQPVNTNELKYDPSILDQVKQLVTRWAPLVLLAPEEKFFPYDVHDFMQEMGTEMHGGVPYLTTKDDVDLLLKNESSYLYGTNPLNQPVPVYATVRICSDNYAKSGGLRSIFTVPPWGKRWTNRESNGNSNEPSNEAFLGNEISENEDAVISAKNVSKRQSTDIKNFKKNTPQFYVSYWMFYPFNEGKDMCNAHVGFLGTWPIPRLLHMCIGTMEKYGNHVGDWEHVSLLFHSESSTPAEIYVSTHNSGAYYKIDEKRKMYQYQRRDTQKGLGIIERPSFPSEGHLSADGHPVVYVAKGSHGLWAAAGNNRITRLLRMYDDVAEGVPWKTWEDLHIIIDSQSNEEWTKFQGRWGNKRHKCNAAALCQYVDGPEGILNRRQHFKC